MGVGADDAEGADTGECAGGVGGPGGGAGGQTDVGVVEVDARVAGLVVDQGRDLTVVDAEQGLDQAGDARGGLEMAVVGLQGAHVQGTAAVAGAEGGDDGAHLDGVAEGGAGAVGFDQADVGGAAARVGERGLDDPALGGGVGGGEAGGAAVLVDGAAVDDAEDAVAVAFGVGEPFEDDDGAAFAADVAVGAGVEGLARAVGGQGAGLVDHAGGGGGEDEVDTARHSHRAFAAAQGLHRLVHGDQRGRAGGVDGDGGAGEAEGVGEPARGEAVAGAEGGEGVDPAGEPVGVVGSAGEADEGADRRAVRDRRVEACVCPGSVGGFQQQPVLGVHRLGGARAELEEVGVEVQGVVEEAAGGGQLRPLVLEGPAAVRGHRPDGGAALAQDGPEVGEGVGVRGAQGGPDDRDRTGGVLFGELFTQTGDGRGGPSQCRFGGRWRGVRVGHRVSWGTAVRSSVAGRAGADSRSPMAPDRASVVP